MSDPAKYKEKLFEEFPTVSEKEWKNQIVKDLKGREFEKLIWKTYEDIEVNPFYTEKSLESINYLMDSLPGEYPFVRGAKSTNNDWRINQEISEADIGLANTLALNCLNGGADSLTFNCEIDDEKCSGTPIQSKTSPLRPSTRSATPLSSALRRNRASALCEESRHNTDCAPPMAAWTPNPPT